MVTRLKHLISWGLLLIAFVVVSAQPAVAQDPLELTPFKPFRIAELEAEAVRILATLGVTVQ